MSKHKQLKVIQERNSEMLMKGCGLKRSASPARRRDWETDRKSTRLNSSHSAKARMPSSA